VIRRRSRTWVFIAVAAVGVAGTAGRAGASTIATYQLVNTGTTTVTQVLAEISPAGAVFAPTSSSTNPFTIIYTPSGPSGTSASSGFDSTTSSTDSSVAPPTDAIGTGKLANGDPLQVLNLQFDKNGFAPGGVLNFSLNLGSNFAGPTPTLILEDPTTGLTPAGLSITPFTAPTSTPTGSGSSTSGTGSGTGTGTGTTTSGGGSSTPTAQVPEPISLALWSVAAGLGLLRAKAFRRARQMEV
jgi:hypothetical protein